MGTVQGQSDKAKDPGAQAQHKDKQPGDQYLARQLAEMRAKIAGLETALANSQASGMNGVAGSPVGPGAGVLGGNLPGAQGFGGQGGMGGMQGFGGGLGGMQGFGGQGGMGGMQGFGGGLAGMQGFSGIGGGVGGFGFGGLQGGFGGFNGPGGSMEDTDMMEMVGMMGMAPKSVAGMGGMKTIGKMQQQAALPGFPGASHIYHVGATAFFLNHPQHIKLTTKQTADLVRIQKKAILVKTTAQRRIDEAEQELWTLTSADEPDLTKIAAKVQEIEQLRGDQRMVLIRAVGDAAKLLTDEQRRAVLGISADKTAEGKKGRSE
jgi:hypothetical protein